MVTEKSTCSVKHANVECGKLIYSGNSTNLINHLRACYKAQFAEFEEKKIASLSASSQSMKHGVDKITSFLSQPAMHHATKYILLNIRPTSISRCCFFIFHQEESKNI